MSRNWFARSAIVVRLNTPIDRVQAAREIACWSCRKNGQEESFDHAVLAAPTQTRLCSLLEEPTTAEREILGAFPYQKNECVLHTDSSLLPRRRRAWASWNYQIPAADGQPVALTYDVNRLQGLGAPAARVRYFEQYCNAFTRSTCLARR